MLGDVAGDAMRLRAIDEVGNGIDDFTVTSGEG